MSDALQRKTTKLTIIAFATLLILPVILNPLVYSQVSDEDGVKLQDTLGLLISSTLNTKVTIEKFSADTSEAPFEKGVLSIGKSIYDQHVVRYYYDHEKLRPNIGTIIAEEIYGDNQKISLSKNDAHPSQYFRGLVGVKTTEPPLTSPYENALLLGLYVMGNASEDTKGTSIATYRKAGDEQILQYEHENYKFSYHFGKNGDTLASVNIQRPSLDRKPTGQKDRNGKEIYSEVTTTEVIGIRSIRLNADKSRITSCTVGIVEGKQFTPGSVWKIQYEALPPDTVFTPFKFNVVEPPFDNKVVIPGEESEYQFIDGRIVKVIDESAVRVQNQIREQILAQFRGSEPTRRTDPARGAGQGGPEPSSPSGSNASNTAGSAITPDSANLSATSTPSTPSPTPTPSTQSTTSTPSDAGTEIAYRSYLRSSSSRHCGVYSAVVASELLGKPIELESLPMEDYISSVHGSTAEDVVRLLREQGLHGFLVTNADAGLFQRMAGWDAVAILHFGASLQVEGVAHWAVTQGLNADGRLTVIDLPRDPESIAVADLLTTWDGTAIVVSKHPVTLAQRLSSYSGLAVSVVLVFSVLAAGVFLQRRLLPQPRGIPQAALLCLLALGFALVWYFASPQGFANNPFAVNLTRAKVITGTRLQETPNVDALELDDHTAIVDARLPLEYKLGHIPGAVNLPIDASIGELGATLSALQNKKRLYVYCNNDRCGWASALAAKLSLFHPAEQIVVYKPGYTGYRESLGHRLERSVQ